MRQALRDAEVEDLDERTTLPHDDHHVARGQVAVDEAGMVCRDQRLADLLEDLDDDRWWQRLVAVDALVERDAVDLLHRDVNRAVLRLADVEDATGVFVGHPPGLLGLRQEVLTVLAPHGEPRVEDLQRDRDQRDLVDRPEHGAHAPLAEHPCTRYLPSMTAPISGFAASASPRRSGKCTAVVSESGTPHDAQVTCRVSEIPSHSRQIFIEGVGAASGWEG